MPYLILTLLLALLVYLPSLWVTLVMRKHSAERSDIPGTGGELASHLIERFELGDIKVEETTDRNDHYDPSNLTVRLSPSNYQGRSLTAIAVAAHEVGHAIQFQRQEPVSQLRNKFVPTALLFKKSGVILMTLLPLVGILARAPSAVFALIALSLGLQLLGALFYLVVLPEEWDASYKKALPILLEGDYVAEDDIPAINSILRAAALTYFSAALADLVNIGRWIMILRR